jgi:hypothetical protein
VLRSWFGKKDVPLTGAPAVRRIKNYSAESGYVYQYAYEGQRPASRNGGVEFVFSSSADRKTWHLVSVFVEESPVRAWEQAHDRVLSSTEWYALAKMMLFAAFDQRATPAAMHGAPVRLRDVNLDDIMNRLGIDE